MKKHIKKLALSLSLILGFSAVQPMADANAATNENNTNLEQVVIYEDDASTIVSLVDKKDVESYKKRIKTDEAFRNKEIENANPNKRLPAGQMLQQKSMYYNDIKATVDRISGYGTFAQIMSNPLSDLVVGSLVKAAGAANVWGLAATCLAWMGGNLIQREQAWWTQSFIMILSGQIRCVRVSHIRNTVSDYPAAYLIFERL